MKVIFARLGSFLLVLAAGIAIFTLLVFAGDRFKGPFEDLVNGVDARVARAENKLLSANEKRAASLTWINKYRNNKTALNAVDTLLLGAYDDGTKSSYENIIKLEDAIDTKLPIVSIYTAWGGKKEQNFPLLRAQTIYDLGSIPMITWEPWLNDFDPIQYPNINSNKNKGGMRSIAEGKYDRYIDKWAEEARKFGLPFFLRWGHEMNDPIRYPWGQQNNTPADFVAAWKHIVDRFRALGADNAIWVWSPHPAYATYNDFYPGDDYVDWVGLTVLNYGKVASWSNWWSFQDIAGKAYNELQAKQKPVMLTEFGSLAVGGNRAQWFRQAFNQIRYNYPQIKAVVFFHAAQDITVSYMAFDWTFREDKEVVWELRKILRSNHGTTP